MIIPDLNLVLYAYHATTPKHKAARVWWEQLLSGSAVVGIPWLVIMGFIRISTNTRIFDDAVGPDEAVLSVKEWLEKSCVRILHPGPRHPEIFFGLLNHSGTAGNLTADAHIAALAIEYNATVHTADTDFVRFAGCRWINPLD